MAYTYVIRCEDDTLYTGIAKDLNHRMQDHYYKTKQCAKYTKVHGIKEIEIVWETDEWSDAAKLEYLIKRLSRREKQQLIANPKTLDLYLEESQKTLYRPILDMHLKDCINKGCIKIEE